MSNIIDINETTFGPEVVESPLPVLVQAHARTCPPCRQMSPIIEELADEVDGKAKIVRFEVGRHYHLAIGLEIKAVPTFVVFRNGQVVARLIGVQSKDRLLEALGLK